MATDTAHRLDTAFAESEGLLSKAGLQLRQFVCGLHGHDALKHFEQGRISLLCVSCGHETPGWDIKPTSATVQNSDSSRRIVRMPLVRERRVA
jgi:hypothetical protein